MGNVGHVGAIVGSLWYHVAVMSRDVEIILASFRDPLRIIPGSDWSLVMIILESCLDHVGINLGSFWDQFEIVSGSS